METPSPSGTKFCHEKLRVLEAAHSEDFVILLYRFERAAECDRQTDRQTDAQTMAKHSPIECAKRSAIVRKN